MVILTHMFTIQRWKKQHQAELELLPAWEVDFSDNEETSDIADKQGTISAGNYNEWNCSDDTEDENNGADSSKSDFVV